MANNMEARALCHSAVDELCHYGVLGMRWGIRRYQPYPKGYAKGEYHPDRERAMQTVKYTKSYNLDSFGSSPSTNILYVIGGSGSGKSTLAKAIAKEGDTVIHLDAYSERPDAQFEVPYSRKLNQYLSRKGFNLTSIWFPEDGQTDPKYWENVDAFRDLVNNYAASEWRNGNRVVVEGVQLADGWYSELKALDGSPCTVIQPSAIKHTIRAAKRDNLWNESIIGGLKGTVKKVQENRDYYKRALNEFMKMVDSGNNMESNKGDLITLIQR